MCNVIYRRAGALENADHGERFVVVLDQTDRGHAVGQHQFVTELVMQRIGHFRTEYHFKRIGGKRTTVRQLQMLLATVLVMLEVGFGSAHHPVATMGVAEGHRDRPLHFRVAGEVFEAVPADVVGGVADAEHRVQQQVHRAGTGTNDEVGAADSTGETGFGLGAHPLNGEQQTHREGDGKSREQSGEAAVGQAGHGQTKQIHLRPRQTWRRD